MLCEGSREEEGHEEKKDGCDNVFKRLKTANETKTIVYSMRSIKEII